MTQEQLPGSQEKVSFDLDSYERDTAQVPPFKVNVAGKVITMTDPDELDWADLLLIDQPNEFLHYCLNAEDRKYLREQRFPGWKFRGLMEAYMEHYQLEERIREGQRKQGRSGAL